MTTNRAQTNRVQTRDNRRRGGTAMRLRGLVRKEFLQIVRDPSSLAIAFVMPVVLLLLFGYGVSLDAENVRIGLVVDAPSSDTASLQGELEHSRYFAPVRLAGMHAARRAMQAHRIDALVHLRDDFSEKLRRAGGADIQLIVNGVDANTARLTIGYFDGVYAKWLQRRNESRGRSVSAPVRVESRVWYNSNLRSRNFLVPGLIAVIMTLIGALLTALVMAREWERGTMEAMMVTPVAMREVLIGKIVPYFVLGVGAMTLSVVMALWQFGVPLRGSLWALALGTLLFLMTALGMGLLISTVARVQFVAAQIAIVTTFLPAFILSGFIFDVRSMPTPIQMLTRILPARYFVELLQTVFLAGDVWSVFVPDAAALAVMAVLFLSITRRKARKRLD